MPNIENLLRFSKPQRGEGHEEQREENSFAFSCLFSSKRRGQKWELLVGEVLRRVLEPGGSPRALDRYCVTQSEEISPIFWCVVCGFFIILLLFPNFKYQTLKHPQLYSTNTHTEGSRENKFYIYRQQKGTVISKASFPRPSPQSTVHVPNFQRCSVSTSFTWRSPNVLPIIPRAKNCSCITKSATSFSCSQKWDRALIARSYTAWVCVWGITGLFSIAYVCAISVTFYISKNSQPSRQLFTHSSKGWLSDYRYLTQTSFEWNMLEACFYKLGMTYVPVRNIPQV